MVRPNGISLAIGLLLSSSGLLVASQEFTDCHSHGSTMFCVGPDGKEVPVSTEAPAPTQPPSVSATTTAAAQTTAVTDCHTHSSQTFCIAGDGQEVQVTGTGTPTTEPPAQYTDCHAHGDEQFCMAPNGDEVQVLRPEHTSAPGGGHGESGGKKGQNCHFHAGVEHCVGEGESEGSAPMSCGRTDREYNIPLRIGSIFVILVTSSIAVFGPILWARFFNSSMNGIVFTIIKQFGTGIMVATAFIHLYTHAHLMFGNQCLGELTYESTTSAIVMAGIFLSFLVEYIGNRIILSRTPDCNPHAHCDVEPQPSLKSPDGSTDSQQHPPALTDLGHHHHTLARPDDKLSVLVMEAGIVFHSIIIGLTLVVAGDSGYVSLFIVIIFHQMFEGLALGARIAHLAPTLTASKLIMAGIFTLITPIGMAIGMGVLHEFNGNDPSTIIAIGTLDALSAGILAWVALIDMWSHDWLTGDLAKAGPVKVCVGMTGLIGGMALMGLLGKWA
ncbi:hypothetical protein AJ79_08637 [Helicocarpus griseus UAMH5409]|uniref:ZIP Zinc transporter n=1 Tax=Helicocarpus griseus UAMH5409 TaxID=1447875 RepID=A0A2B7WR65_9EURO|nr:hypothetical protein AJ79_08637 [Helicocarpus griseus UAMH5409]